MRMRSMYALIGVYVCVYSGHDLEAILKRFVKFSSLINCRHRKQTISPYKRTLWALLRFKNFPS